MLLIFLISVIFILLFFIFYPIFLFAVGFFSKRKDFSVTYDYNDMLSIIIVVRNAGEIIVSKLENIFSVNIPNNSFEVIVFSDGSDDDTRDKVLSFNSDKVHFYENRVHRGKNRCLNDAVAAAKGGILLFTDADALFHNDSVAELLKYFYDGEVGGVCGRRIIGRDESTLKDAQKSYIAFDSLLKKYESSEGRITANDGKIYAIRKDLYKVIPDGVTDDSFVCLSIIRQDKYFLYQPSAVAYVNVPSRNRSHEIIRRRRIITGSLKGIFINRELLNPFKYGIFSINLLVNKIIRRLIPFFLIMLFVSNAFLYNINLFMLIVFLLQLIFYMSALVFPLIQKFCKINIIVKLSSIPFYFVVANYGMMMGVLDFLMGREITKWTPVKKD